MCLAQLEVDMVNLHAAGTERHDGGGPGGPHRSAGKQRPLLIAVTQLTSTSRGADAGGPAHLRAAMDETVLHYAKNARDAGLDGVVCSPLEAGKVHDRLRHWLPDRHPRRPLCRRQRR